MNTAMTKSENTVAVTAGSPTCATVSRQALEAWPVALQAAGYCVIAPQPSGPRGESEYRRLTGAGDWTALANGLPRHSPKGAYFPRSEVVLRIQKQGRTVSVDDPSMEFPQIVIFGARPCDAAAPEVLAPLFGWDYHDPFFERRLKQITFVTAACDGPVDNACFCTSVGVDPAGENIGDVVITALASGELYVQACTDRGRQLLEAMPVVQRPSATPPVDLQAMRQKARQAVPVRFDAATVSAALEKRFEDPMWQESAKSCLACGTCAFVCPTCHCFDLQDEMAGATGIRQKNWDACAFPLFTLHTSGHNPRPDQASRWRQRLNHKFRYYPGKFGHVLCTGCGRCLRLCPAGMDMLADLQTLAAPSADVTAISAAPAPSAASPAPSPTPVASVPDNLYRPYIMRIVALQDETPDVRTLRLEFVDATIAGKFDFAVGQFGLYSPIGEGESTFCIASSSTRKGYIECTFRQAGRVTHALRRLGVGDLMGFRGPYGNRFPVESWKGKDLLFVAGGIALPPMRCVIQYCLDHRADYGDITIIYGARTWSDHVYKNELAEWEKRNDVNLWLCVDWKPAASGGGLSDQPAEEGWRPLNLKDPSASVLDPAHRRYTGFVPGLVDAVKPSAANRIAVVCGPPIMIKFTLASLKKLSYSAENVFTTLENRMKCGVGKCGRCNVGSVYVCKEGPVFTAAEIEHMPPEM